MKKLATACAAGILALTQQAAVAEISANVSAVSNYVFRGVTQTNDQAAIQGGLDYAHESGFYLGTWMSNVSYANAEVDFYGGFAGDAGEIGYDAGVLYFFYPDGGEIDYAEIYGSLSFGMFTGTINYTVWGETDSGPFDTGDIYLNASADIPVMDTVSLSPQIGYYNFDDDPADMSYLHWGVSLAKDTGQFGEFSLSYEQNDGADDAPMFWVGWSKSFD